MDHNKCSDEKCWWPRYHEDLRSLKDSNKYMGQVIVSDYPTSLRQTRLTKRKETTNLTKMYLTLLKLN